MKLDASIGMTNSVHTPPGMLNGPNATAPGKLNGLANRVKNVSGVSES